MQKIFKKLLKSATIYDQELNREIDIVEKNCDIGLKYRGKKVETSTRIFLIQITVDLKEIDRTYTLHLILVDHATRCSAATYVKKKKKGRYRRIIMYYQTIGKNLILSYFVKYVNSLINTTMKSTAEKAPWSNGIVERHSAVLGKMINKLTIGVLIQKNCITKLL